MGSAERPAIDIFYLCDCFFLRILCCRQNCATDVFLLQAVFLHAGRQRIAGCARYVESLPGVFWHSYSCTLVGPADVSSVQFVFFHAGYWYRVDRPEYRSSSYEEEAFRQICRAVAGCAVCNVICPSFGFESRKIHTTNCKKPASAFGAGICPGNGGVSGWH